MYVIIQTIVLFHILFFFILGTFKILPEHRANCITLFSSMTEEMDKDETGEVNVIGRWVNTSSASGSCLFEAPNGTAIGSWLHNWFTMVTNHITPVVDDNMARKIILKEEPSWKATYDKVGHEAPEGYSLYTIHWKTGFAQRAECDAAFSSMTEEQDKTDTGDVINMGRYHNLGNGTGFCICAAKSEYDLQACAYNWNTMGDCTIEPVMSDTEIRGMVKSKPNYAMDLVKAKAATGIV